MAEIRTLRGAKKYEQKLVILFYFIFQCGAHKQKELKKMEKKIGMICLTFQRKKKRKKQKKEKEKDGSFWLQKLIYTHKGSTQERGKNRRHEKKKSKGTERRAEKIRRKIQQKLGGFCTIIWGVSS